jgi:hypothetical protein
MASERQLIRGHRSWWARWTPGLDASLMMRMSNPESPAPGQVLTWESPVFSALPPRDSDLIAESAFGLFAYAAEAKVPVELIPPDQVGLAVKGATDRILILRGTGRSLEGLMTPEHIQFAQRLAIRLLAWASKLPGVIEIQPKLPGAGIIDHCHPDLICGTELIEVKMSRTLFRLPDLQQLLVYSALAWLGTDRQIERVTLTNPMLGVAWTFELRPLIREISGLSTSRFFEQFHEMSRGDARP